MAEQALSLAGIPIRNAWYLLLYAWELAQWRDRHRSAVEDSPSLLGLLAHVLTETTGGLLRRGLGREFMERATRVRGVRGKIDFARSLKHLDFQSGHATCVFSQLDVDTPRNRILRSTLERLRRDPRVDHARRTPAIELRQRIGSVVAQLRDVELTELTNASFARLQPGTNDRAYALPMAICKLLHRLALPTEAAGDHALVALEKDLTAFRALFERFVRNFWRYHLTGFDIRSERLGWFDELSNPLVPGMQTDITLTTRRPPHRRIVVDTKFSATTLAAAPHGTDKFKSANLYQIYAYLRTQEHRGDEFRAAEGMLLYPTTSGEFDEVMKVQGHRIRVATINLAAPWEEMHTRLLSLVD